jgi:citronellol/citronellal dehydrogenase
MAQGASLDIFRRGLLAGQTVAIVSGGPIAEAAAAACADLGAEIERHDGQRLDDASAAAFAAGVVERHGGLNTLVLDVWSAFAAAAPGAAGADALRAAADPAWAATRAAAQAAMIDAEVGGKVVLIGPPPGAGARAQATRAALENLARTLSIEWSRYAIRTTAILPGDATSPDEIAAVVAFLASPAGDYYSGCLMDLGSSPA